MKILDLGNKFGFGRKFLVQVKILGFCFWVKILRLGEKNWVWVKILGLGKIFMFGQKKLVWVKILCLGENIGFGRKFHVWVNQVKHIWFG